MSTCNKTIQEKCNIFLNNQEKNDIENCLSVMETFNAGVETCKQNETNCSCWASLVLTVANVSQFKL